MSTAVDCKRSVNVEIPLDEVLRAKERVTESIKKRVRLPGFRPGKAPISLIQSRFETEIRSEVLEVLLPQAFREKVREEGLDVVGTPDISDLQFEPDQPIRFKAGFEVAPAFEIGDYEGIAVKYEEPTVTDEEIASRLESMRESKSDYVNEDPRPIKSNDHVLLHLKSVSGLAEPIDEDGLAIQVGAEESLPEFTEGLIGMSPEESKEIDVTYPADYAQERLAGKTVRFQLTPKFVRRKELPALDDEFARDLGDYQNITELRESVRKSIFQEKQFASQQTAKEELIDKLVDAHPFSIPEAYVDRQIENQVRLRMRNLASRGIDPTSIKLDWDKIKEDQRDKAIRNVRAALLLEKIAQKQGMSADKEEVDREVQRLARQDREAVAVTRAKLEKEGTLSRIADHIQTEKTIQFLFDHARKEA